MQRPTTWIRTTALAGAITTVAAAQAQPPARIDSRTMESFAQSVDAIVHQLDPQAGKRFRKSLETIITLAPNTDVARRQLHGGRARQVMAIGERLLREADTDGNGTLSSDEVTAAKSEIKSMRMAAGEKQAVIVLNELARAQAIARERAYVDVDDDGKGEYCFLGELAGSARLRDRFGEATGAPIEQLLRVPLALRDSTVERGGYVFQLWLPTAVAAVTDGPQAGGGIGTADDSAPDASNAEQFWVAYAWPAVRGQSGNKVFAITQEGQVMESDNEHQQYSGSEGPDAYAVFHMGTRALGEAFGGNRLRNDGGVWLPLGSLAAPPATGR